METRVETSDYPDILLEFLEVCFNSILYSRRVYPSSIFVLKKKYDVPVHISIYPDLNQYIFQVLSSAKQLYLAKELKQISLWILDQNSKPIEKFVFNNFELKSTSNLATNQPCIDLKEVYESCRTVCLKLSLLDQKSKVCSDNSSFKIYIETKESSLNKFYKEPYFEQFPWVPVKNTEDKKPIMSEDKIGSLEDEALRRKERLKNLKRKAQEPGSDDVKTTEVPVLPKPKFRSYQPEDDKLKENILPAATPGDVVKEVKEHLEAANSRVVIEELDLTNLAPRKPDWDLKRDVAKKLERLEKRTQRAIAELIRERLKTGQADLATSVNIGSRTNQDDVDED